jgi:N-acetyl-1-D-myo-inositol-2-amino-2-deoxy-alpha-D-glucopyranoside deacetylase
VPKQTFNAKRLLVVHAHPDDESIFTGHIIAERLAAGAEVYVLTLTRGERGKVKLEELKGLEGQLRAMGAFRSGELKVALSELQKAGSKLHHSFAGTRAFLDSGMRINSMGRPTKKNRTDEMALASASTAVIAEDIERVMNEFKPDAILTYNSKGGYGHPDHKMAHHATAMAIRHYRRQKRRAPQFWVIAEPNERFDVAIGDAKTAKFKRAALEAHSSQVSIFPETYSIGATETRYDAPERIRKATPSPLVHLLPLLTFFWAIPLGVLLGLSGTLLHSIKTTDTSEFPIGLTVALTMVASLALALRILRNSRGALYLMTASFLSTVYLLSQKQPGGEILIVANQVGDTWVYGSMAICALIMLFPKLNPSSWRRSASGHR